MTPDTLVYLSRRDIEEIALPMTEIIAVLEKMFVEKGEGRVEMPPKPGIHPLEDSFIHAMPASIPSMGAAGMKWIAGFPRNGSKGLPYINGLLVLNDPETGIPIAVMDATWITAQRTGAATAVAAKWMARPASQTAGIIACGVQGRSNLEALKVVCDIKQVKAYDINREVAEVYARDMERKLDVEVEVVSNPKDAVAGLDLVVTSGPILKHPEPVIQAGWLAPGAFASPVDFDSYWCGEALAEADRIATDDLGQMEYYRNQGYFRQTPAAYADLGEILTGKKPGRLSEDERLIAINLGIGLEDMATAVALFKRAQQFGIGTTLPL